MNMFMLRTKPQWGLLVGLGAVGPAAAWLVLVTDPRAARLSWMIALAAIVFGAGSASLLALQQNSTTLWEAARLGAYAWMAVTFVVSFLLFWLNPFLILSLAVTVPGRLPPCGETPPAALDAPAVVRFYAFGCGAGTGELAGPLSWLILWICLSNTVDGA